MTGCVLDAVVLRFKQPSLVARQQMSCIPGAHCWSKWLQQERTATAIAAKDAQALMQC